MTTLTLYRINECTLNAPNLHTKVFTDRAQVSELKLKDGVRARLFYLKGQPKRPEWADYLDQVTAQPLSTRPKASDAAILLVASTSAHDHLYAATWGNGFLALRPECIHPDLGLRCALNLAAESESDGSWNPDRLRAVRTKRFARATLTTQMQASRNGSFDDFPVNTAVDQLRQVTAAPGNAEGWGSSVTGGTSLHIRRPKDPKDIVRLCRDIDKVYASKNYRARYAWVDNISPVRDASLLHRAIEALFMRIDAGMLGTIDLAPPALIEWKEVGAFELRRGKQFVKCADLSSKVLDSCATQLGINFVNDGWNMNVAAIDQDGNDRHKWPLWKCLTAEVEIDGMSYVFDEGALYQVEAKFLNGLNAFVDGLGKPQRPLLATLPNEAEEDYLKRLCTKWPEALLLDQRTVIRDQATAIEICDIALSTRVLMHFKRGTGSKGLSHLFAQGAVSAELLQMDDDFRAKSREKIEDVAKARSADFRWISESPFRTGDCEVAFAIMTGRTAGTKNSQIPFFGKINLRQRCEDLRRMGYRFSLALIPST